jgi:hypothetical protein
MNHDPFLFGLLAEFDSPDKLVHATKRTHAAGYRKINAYTPYPVEGLDDALDLHQTYVAPIVLAGGVLGAITGFALQYYASTYAYPINVGGRPFNTWPMFIPIVFEMTILFAGLSAVFGMLALNGLPMPYHPVFNVPHFALATRDRFFLVVETADPKFDKEETRHFLQSLGPTEVSDVPQ